MCGIVRLIELLGPYLVLLFRFSVELIILMLYELVDVFDERARLFYFKFIINSLVFLLTCIQPFITIRLFPNEKLIPAAQNILKRAYTVVAYLGWFFILRKCDLSQAFTPNKSSFGTKMLIERKINEISIAGITTMAILSGVGSSSTPFKVFSINECFHILRAIGLYTTNKTRMNEADVNNLFQSYNHTTSLINKRKNKLNKLQVAKVVRFIIYQIHHQITSSCITVTK